MAQLCHGPNAAQKDKFDTQHDHLVASQAGSTYTCGLLCRPCMVIRTTNRKEYFVIFLVLKWLKIKSLVKLCVRSLWIFLFFIYFFTFENWHWKECMVNFEFLAHTQVTHRHSIFFFSWFHDFRMSFHHLFRLSLQFSGSFFVISSRFLVNTIHHTK